MLFSTSTIAFTAVSFLSLASAQPAAPRATPEAYVTIERYLGNAFGDVTQHTVIVPIGEVYTNEEALAAVSTLYLKGAGGGVDKESVTCTPYKGTDGTGSGGLPFTSEKPSYLSTNTVVVGSIVCNTA